MLALEIIGYILLFLLSFAGGAYASIYLAFHVPGSFWKVKYNGKELTDLSSDGKPTTGYDLYLPEGEPRPCGLVMYIHGGGFTGGKRQDGALQCKYYASHGYAAATVDYTLHTPEHGSNLNLMNSELFAAVKAIKEKCAELGYTLNGMATTGESAGGCLALLYAYSHGEDSPVPIKCVFQMTGPALFEPDGWGNETPEEGAKFAAMMTGVDITPVMMEDGSYRQYVDAISPARLVSNRTVPTLNAYGPKDKIVPPTLKFSMFEAFEKHCVHYDYIEYPHSNHGMYADLKKHKEYIAKTLEYCRTYLSN